MPHHIYLGIPHYGTMVHEAVGGIMTASSKERIHVAFEGGSLLTMNFNNLWANALNMRGDGITHFAMMHADIATKPNWLDILLEEMESHEADVCSAIVPIKDARGVTSTAVVDKKSGEIRRLTMTEVMNLPETFGDEVCQPHHYIAMNTGLWVARITEPWAERVCFNIRDEIRRRADGIFEAMVLSEDWNFSAWARSNNVKIVVTRKVLVGHVGPTSFTNQAAWGTSQTEGAWLKSRQEALAVS